MKSIKTLGIAMAMALALIAFVGAGTASANNFSSSTESATWAGSLSGKSHVQIFSSGGSSESVVCSEVGFSGAVSSKKTSELTVTPVLNSCNAQGFLVNWSMNGCKYRFHAGAGPSLVGSVDIVGCTKPMSLSYGACVKEIGNQNGIGTVTYTNVGPGTSVTFTANLQNINFTVSGCFGIPGGTYSLGSYTGTWTVKSTGNAVEVESTPAAPVWKFVAQEAPASVTVKSSSSKFMGFPQGQGVQCATSGSTEMAGGEAEGLTFVPTLSGCSMQSETEGISTSMGGCSFKFRGSGTFEIVGSTCAAAPITFTHFKAGVECTVTVGPQGPLSGISFYNEGSGTGRVVRKAVSPEIKGLKYTAVGPHCEGEGTFTDGTYRQPLIISATNSKGAAQGIWVE